MFSKSTLVGTLFSFLVLYLLGWFYYGFFAAEFYESHSNLNMVSMLPSYIALGTLIFSFGFSNLYRKSSNALNPSKISGFIVGAWIGFTIGFGFNIISFGSDQSMDLTATIAEAIWCLIYYGLAGASIGWAFQLTAPKKNHHS